VIVQGFRSATAQPFATPGASPPKARPWLALILAALLAFGALARPAPALALNDAQQLVVDAWRLVNQSYVDPGRLEAVHWRQLRQKTLEKPIASSAQAYDAIESLLAPLGDPYTRILRPADYGTLRSNTKGTVDGVGLQLGLRDGDQRIVVIAPLDDSPAAEASILTGTELLQVDGVETASLGLERTAAQLRGPSGSEVLLTLRSPGGRQKEVLLRRRQVELRPVRFRRLKAGGHSLGYLRITQFSEPVPQQVRDALVELGGGGNSPAIEGLILDLRNNSGGLVSAGLAVANAVLDGEPIVVTEDRGGIAARQQAGPGSLYAGPMLTLVNGGTASASEILAGALQDSGRSPLAGSRTFGKGLIQTLLSLGDGSGLAVTVARYLTPSGRDIQNQGIEPDRTLAPPEPLNPGGKDDSWLEDAVTLLLERLASPSRPAATAAPSLAMKG
jgi:carboxyl-terminal processing protease